MDDPFLKLIKIPKPIVLFIPIMLGVKLMAILYEYLVPGKNTSEIITIIGGLYLITLAILWVLFGNALWPKSDNNDS